MNRTITMNLSGIIFHIEEDAYEKLNKYLATIKGYFANSDGRDEIMNDIEARIAEMLQEKVSASKQAVLMADIESVIAVMGKPEEFAGEDTSAESAKNSSATAEKVTSKRKRIFRDPDDKILGGVCSGISNYLDIDPIWLRAAFVISMLVFGSGLLLYIILWIIIPLAKTTAEKLEMHGEKVDVNNIGKAVTEEFDDLKKRMKDFGDEVGSKAGKDRIRTTTQKAIDLIGNLFYTFFKVVGKILATIIVIIAVLFLVILLASLFGSNTIHIDKIGEDLSFSIYDLHTKFFPSDLSIQYLVIGLLLFIGIPLLAIIYSGSKLLFGIKHKNRIVKYTFFILWWVGLSLLIYVGASTLKDFSEEATTKENIKLMQKDTLFLSVKNPGKYPGLNYHHPSHFKFAHLKWSHFEDHDENELYFLFPVTLDILPSETDSLHLVLIKSARGSNKKEAQYLTKTINYKFSQIDSLIEFEPDFQIGQTDKWRNQHVEIILKVPVNKVIYLNKGMEHLIFNIDNVDNAFDNDMVNRRWKMTNEGLKCIDCLGLNSNTITEQKTIE